MCGVCGVCGGEVGCAARCAGRDPKHGVVQKADPKKARHTRRAGGVGPLSGADNANMDARR